MNAICFGCKKPLEVEPCSDNRAIQPLYGGLWFTATGNFGSTIFDPVWDTGQFMRIVVCDECARNVPVQQHTAATIADSPTDTGEGNP